jgi:MFS family permease
VKQLALLAAAIWGVAYARAALGPLQEAIRVDLALSDYQIAWLQGPALALPMALAAVPFGLLVNRCSRVVLLGVFVALSFLGTVAAVLASSLSALFMSRCVIGLAIAAITVTVYSMVADLYPPAQRGRATMVVAVGEVGGAPAAFTLGGYGLAVSLSQSLFGLAPWRAALLELSLLLIPVMALMLFVRDPVRTGLRVENPSLRGLWPELWTYRTVLGPLLLARMMMWIADGAVLVWAAPSFARRFHLSPDVIGALMGTVLLVSGLLGPLLGGPLADFCQRTGGPRRTVMALTVLAMMSVPAALFALAPDAMLACVLLAVFLTQGYTLGTAALTLGTIVIPGELRGVYLALSVTMGALFFVGVAPLVISGVATMLGGESMLGEALAMACGGSSFLGAIILFSMKRYFPAASRAQ